MRYRFGDEIKVRSSEPEGRTKRFSIHVPLGNWYTRRVGSSGRLNGMIAQKSQAELGKRMAGRIILDVSESAFPTAWIETTPF